MPRRRHAAPVSLLLVAALGCGGEKAVAPSAATTPEERAVQVRTLTLAPRPVVDRASLPADLQPLRRATLASEIGGRVEAVRAELGAAVP
jgi:hypothetical protein